MKSRIIDMNDIKEIINLIYSDFSLMKEDNNIPSARQVADYSFSLQALYSWTASCSHCDKSVLILLWTNAVKIVQVIYGQRHFPIVNIENS